jgi:hypothetical protein
MAAVPAMIMTMTATVMAVAMAAPAGFSNRTA